MFKKLVVSGALVAGVVVGAASPSYAFFCGNASKNPDAGTVEFKESGSQANFDTSAAWNSTVSGAWVDSGEFGGEPGVVVFARNGLAPAAFVGSPDHGIVEAE